MLKSYHKSNPAFSGFYWHKKVDDSIKHDIIFITIKWLLQKNIGLILANNPIKAIDMDIHKCNTKYSLNKTVSSTIHAKNIYKEFEKVLVLATKQSIVFRMSTIVSYLLRFEIFIKLTSLLLGSLCTEAFAGY